MIKVCRIESFNAAHRLHNPAWSDEKNREVFGKCNSVNYHGHNYTFETWVKGEIDPETGYLIDLKYLKKIIHTEILDHFDHRNLNLDLPEFEILNPTAENIVKVIWSKLRAKLSPSLELTVRLFETHKNVVEYEGE